jgi:hypothetical protein
MEEHLQALVNTVAKAVMLMQQVSIIGQPMIYGINHGDKILLQQTLLCCPQGRPQQLHTHKPASMAVVPAARVKGKLHWN